MSGFTVAPDALDQYARLVGVSTESVAAQYHNEAESYRLSYVQVPSDAGGMIFDEVVGVTTDISDKLWAGNVSVNNALAVAASSLAASAETYRETDHRVAVRLDEKYLPSGVVETPNTSLLKGAMPTLPAAVLTPPAGDDDSKSLVEEILDYVGIESVGGLVMKVLDIFGLHPEDWVTERFLGNSDDIAKIANALKQYSQFDLASAKDLAQGLELMLGRWTGHAADAAAIWFATVPDGLQARSNKLTELAELYDNFRDFLNWAKDEIGRVMSAAIDKAIEVASALGAAGCLSSIPGVNFVVAAVGATAAYRLYRAIQDVYDLWDQITHQLSTTLTAFKVLRDFFADWSVNAVALPGNAYYNESQT